MWEAGISGWRADWRPGSDQVARHTDALVSLVGCKLTGAWSIWIGADDWFADMPVVLQFDGSRQLEVCWQKFDDLSISWNTIDVTVAPKAWVEDISWRPWDHTAFTLNEGQVVTSVAATEFVFTTSDVDHPHREPQSATFTGGLWFGTTGPGLPRAAMACVARQAPTTPHLQRTFTRTPMHLPGWRRTLGRTTEVGDP